MNSSDEPRDVQFHQQTYSDIAREAEAAAALGWDTEYFAAVAPEAQAALWRDEAWVELVKRSSRRASTLPARFYQYAVTHTHTHTHVLPVRHNARRGPNAPATAVAVLRVRCWAD